MYKNIYMYISPRSCSQCNLKKSLEFFLFFFINPTLTFFFTDVDNIYTYNTEYSQSANHIIFLDYVSSMEIVVPENFDFQYSKNFLRIRFFRIGLKIGTLEIFTNTLSKNWRTRFSNFHMVLKWHQNIIDKNVKSFFDILIRKKYFYIKFRKSGR